MRIPVHVTPGSCRDEIVGWRGGELSLRVTVPPEDGKANAAACALIATALGVPKSDVRVVRGFRARHKQLDVDCAAEDIARAFSDGQAGR